MPTNLKRKLLFSLRNIIVQTQGLGTPEGQSEDASLLQAHTGRRGKLSCLCVGLLWTWSPALPHCSRTPRSPLTFFSMFPTHGPSPATPSHTLLADHTRSIWGFPWGNRMIVGVRMLQQNTHMGKAVSLLSVSCKRQKTEVGVRTQEDDRK